MPNKAKKAKKVPVYLPSIGKAKRLLAVLKNSHADSLPETEEAIAEGIRRVEKRKKK